MSQFFKTELATAYWLHSMGIKHYTTIEDGCAAWLECRLLRQADTEEA